MQLIWLDNQNRRGVYGFYRSYMPYARISRKEQIALLINDVETLSPDSGIKAKQINDDQHTCHYDSDIKAKQIIAAIRLRPIGEFNLLIGMLVHPDHRGKGIGHQVLNGIADKLLSNETYLFALPHLVGFYQNHGFSQDIQAPNDIQQLFDKYTSQDKDLVMMGYIQINN
ncbi:GNAT family N-acetyltransferase [Shewanella violacea]|nr:GNAT family N-acetyltransferase [Shewanella violacea]